MHVNSPKALILVVTKTKAANGDYIVKLHKVPSVTLPYRVAKRFKPGYDVGLAFVRTLDSSAPLKFDPAGIQAVTVTDGKRALASWRRMDGLAGFTGTHDVHPLINMAGIK